MKINNVLRFIKKDLKELDEKSNNIWNVDNKSDLVYLLYERLIDRLEDFDKFTECEKIFYLCKAFCDELESSGDFNSVYCTDICDYARDISNYFKIIGANQISDIISNINDLFDDDILLDKDEREEFLLDCDEEIDEQLEEYFDEYSEYSDDLEDLLYNYVINNKEKFNV